MATEELYRARAWLLVEVPAPAGEVIQGIYDRLGFEGGEDYVIVRTDRVSVYTGEEEEPNWHCNMVIPVDAKDDECLDIVIKMIKGFGVQVVSILKVTEHIPYPPHIANGYIDPREFDGEPFVEEVKPGLLQVKPGRQGNSPGFNAWG